MTLNLKDLLGQPFESNQVRAIRKRAAYTEHPHTIDAYNEGFSLRFDWDDWMETIFMYALPTEGPDRFQAVDPSIAGVPFYASFDQAMQALLELRPQAISSHLKSWVRADFPDFAVHYEFREPHELEMVTLMAPP